MQCCSKVRFIGGGGGGGGQTRAPKARAATGVLRHAPLKFLKCRVSEIAFSASREH